MIDFRPLLANPKLMIFGAAAQFGIFFTLVAGVACWALTLNDAASIAIIGAADGPTSIFVAQLLRFAATSAPSSWRPIPTWRWCPSCSRPVIRLVHHARRSGRSSMTIQARPRVQDHEHPVPHRR